MHPLTLDWMNHVFSVFVSSYRSLWSCCDPWSLLSKCHGAKPNTFSPKERRRREWLIWIKALLYFRQMWHLQLTPELIDGGKMACVSDGGGNAGQRETHTHTHTHTQHRHHARTTHTHTTHTHTHSHTSHTTHTHTQHTHNHTHTHTTHTHHTHHTHTHTLSHTPTHTTYTPHTHTHHTHTHTHTDHRHRPHTNTHTHNTHTHTHTKTHTHTHTHNTHPTHTHTHTHTPTHTHTTHTDTTLTLSHTHTPHTHQRCSLSLQHYPAQSVWPAGIPCEHAHVQHLDLYVSEKEESVLDQSVFFYMFPGARSSHKQHSYICSNSQQYIVHFSFMPKIIRILSKDHVL